MTTLGKQPDWRMVLYVSSARGQFWHFMHTFMSAVYVCTLRSTPQRAISLNSCVARCRSCNNKSLFH